MTMIEKQCSKCGKSHFVEAGEVDEPSSEEIKDEALMQMAIDLHRHNWWVFGGEASRPEDFIAYYKTKATVKLLGLKPKEATND